MSTRTMDLLKVGFLAVLLISACTAFAAPMGPFPNPPDVAAMAPMGPFPNPPDLAA